MLVVDTLGQFAGLAGDAENNAGDSIAAMQPLLQAASQGLAIQLVSTSASRAVMWKIQDAAVVPSEGLLTLY